MTEKEKDEMLCIKKTIKILEKGFGKGCQDYEEDCIQCRVGYVQRILKEDVLETYKI